MLLIATDLSRISFGKLMEVYEEGNAENAAEFYPKMDRNAGILQAEQDFYAYLTEFFFPTSGAFYAIWEEQDDYRSALRMEPYRDGYLLEAVETAPFWRKRGYASRLLSNVLKQVNAPVYSHVHKENQPSLRLHGKCGFVRIAESADMIDGTVSHACCTLVHRG